MREALSVSIIVLSVVIVVLVAIQSKGEDFSSLMGSSGEGGVQRTRRGLEAVIHSFTIGVGVAFFTLVLVAFFVWGV